MMPFSDLQKLSSVELQKKLGEARAHLLNLQAQAKSQSLKNVRELRVLKKEIARLMLAWHQLTLVK